MPVPIAPTAAVAGQAGRAGVQFNNLAAQVAFLLDPPVVFAYQAAAQSIATATVTVLTMDSELVDTDNVHSLVTNTSRLTIVTAGRYRVTGQIAYAGNVTNYRSALLYKNGAQIAIVRSNAVVNGVTHFIQVVDEVLCAVGDYLELYAEQNSGGNLATIVGSNQTYLKARWAGVS